MILSARRLGLLPPPPLLALLSLRLRGRHAMVPVASLPPHCSSPNSLSLAVSTSTRRKGGGGRRRRRGRRRCGAGGRVAGSLGPPALLEDGVGGLQQAVVPEHGQDGDGVGGRGRRSRHLRVPQGLRPGAAGEAVLAVEQPRPRPDLSQKNFFFVLYVLCV